MMEKENAFRRGCLSQEKMYLIREMLLIVAQNNQNGDIRGQAV
jgi:hypothetical protein